jgi:hypothetical protein
MDTNAILLGLVVVDNRLVETLKRGLVGKISNDQLAGVIVLLLSFGVGALEVLLLPSLAMFAALGATPAADAILTGIVIGAGANGLDILGKGFSAAIDRIGNTTTAVITTTDSDPAGTFTKTVTTSAPVG